MYRAFILHRASALWRHFQEEFPLHTFVKRKQAASFNMLKKSSDGQSRQVENVTIASQIEVQEDHW